MSCRQFIRNSNDSELTLDFVEDFFQTLRRFVLNLPEEQPLPGQAIDTWLTIAAIVIRTKP
jgi:hypothetical protein